VPDPAPANDWQPIDTAPEGVEVMTKIDGSGNEGRLVRQGRLWFLPDRSMYVYYTPTHWKPMPPTWAI
jgi:hypothetical protein